MCPRRHLRLAVAAVLAGALLAAAVPEARAQDETDDQLAFSYREGAANGPENWGKLMANWSTCSSGKMQSPIALSDEAATEVPYDEDAADYFYERANASIINRGHDITVRFHGDAGSLVINGTDYNLTELNWHFPSEHTVANDERTITRDRFILELHLIHKSADNKIAVMAVFYYVDVQESDPFLLRVRRYIEQVSNKPGKEVAMGVIAPPEVPYYTDFYRYMGSLTTPPCTEGVIWTVLKKAIPVRVDQVNQLRDAVENTDDGAHNNARPLQKINDREVTLYRL